jgi:pseudouridine synthase
MRINKFIAQTTGLSRRAADQAIQEGRATINNRPASLGDSVAASDSVTFDGQDLKAARSLTILLNKPVGYVCSRRGQGSATMYDLLPAAYQELKPVGRLDKDSSGLLLLTNDGDLANRLSHPRYTKDKTYDITLDRALAPKHRRLITQQGIQLADGPSRLDLKQLDAKATNWQITMHEGRNRQIRRTFAALGYKVTNLHRTGFGEYRLSNLKAGQYTTISRSGQENNSATPPK